MAAQGPIGALLPANSRGERQLERTPSISRPKTGSALRVRTDRPRPQDSRHETTTPFPYDPNEVAKCRRR